MYLLEKNNSVFIHYKNLQAPAIEMFKVLTKTFPEIMEEVFLVRKLWLRKHTVFRTKNKGNPSK